MLLAIRTLDRRAGRRRRWLESPRPTTARIATSSKRSTSPPADRKAELLDAAGKATARCRPRSSRCCSCSAPERGREQPAGSADRAPIWTNSATRSCWLAAVNIPSLDAGWGLLQACAKTKTTAGRCAARRSRQCVANVESPRPLGGRWPDDERFAAALRTLLADDESAPARAARRSASCMLTALGDDVLALAARRLASTRHSREQAIAGRGAIEARPERPRPCGRCSRDREPASRQAALAGLVDVQDVRAARRFCAATTFPAEAAPRGRRAPGRLHRRRDRAVAADRREAIAGRPASSSVIAKAIAHPDANVRVLYEKFIPEDERPQKLGQAITADEILSLAGDAEPRPRSSSSRAPRPSASTATPCRASAARSVRS